METKNLVGPLVVGVILTALAAVGVVLWRLELHMLYTFEIGLDRARTLVRQFGGDDHGGD